MMAALDPTDPRTATGNPVATPVQVPANLASRSLPLILSIYLFCVVVPIGFNVGPLLVTSLRGFLLVVTLPLWLGIFSGRYGRILVSDIFFVLHILWATLALASNSPAQVLTQTGSTGIEFLGGYALGRAYIRSEAEYLVLCRALVRIACMLVPFAIYETITGSPILIRLMKMVPGMVTVPPNNYPPRLHLSRVQVTFAHPIHFGLFYSVIFSQAFVALRKQVSNAKRYWLSAVIAATGFLSLSSGALLSILLQFGFILWAFLIRSAKYRWWILLGCFVAAYIVIDLFSNRGPIRVFMSYATFSSATAYYRALIFDWGMQNVWASPILGIGMNDWFRPDYMHIASVDNFWLLTTMRYGIPGFMLLAIGFLWSIVRVMRLALTDGSALGLIRRAWVFTFFGLTFTLTTVHIWSNIYSFVFFFFGAGMWMISGAAKTSAPGGPDPVAASASPAAAQSRVAGSLVAGGRVAGSRAAGTPYSRFAPRRRRGGPAADAAD